MAVHAFFTDTEALTLLAICQRAGFVAGVRELRDGLSDLALHGWPVDEVPDLSVCYRGYPRLEVYNEPHARELWERMFPPKPAAKKAKR